jgi:hypothetical protein
MPGLGPSAPDYASLTEDLASHGYVVIGINPTYSSALIEFTDKRIVRQNSSGNIPENLMGADLQSALDSLVEVWSGDITFVLNQAEKINAAGSGSIFQGRLDISRAGAWGHSFGGAASAEAALQDSRLKAAINLDGYPFGKVVNAGLHTPFLQFWSEPLGSNDSSWLDAKTRSQNMLAPLGKDGYTLSLRGAQHFNFSDYALFYAPGMHGLGLLGSINGARGLRITADYTLAFFDHYLKGIPAPLLDGPSSAYPEVQFHAP